MVFAAQPPHPDTASYPHHHHPQLSRILRCQRLGKRHWAVWGTASLTVVPGPRKTRPLMADGAALASADALTRVRERHPRPFTRRVAWMPAVDDAK